MPYPLIIAGLALSAAGAAAGAYGSEQSSQAMNKAVDSSLEQQRQFQQQGRNVFETSLKGSSPKTAQDQMAQGQQKALQSYEQLQAQPLTGATSAVPFETNKGATNVDSGRTQLSNLAQANLQGYSEWDLQQAIKDLTAQGQLGVINNNARGVASILPYQIQAAQHAGDTLTGVGSLLGAAGGLVSGYGALGGSAAGLFGSSVGSGLGALGTINNPSRGQQYFLDPSTNSFQLSQPGYPGASG